MEQSGDRARSSAASDWSNVGEFTSGAYYVKVNHVKGSRKFSVEIGGVAHDGRTMRYVPMVWSQNDGAVEMDGSLDPTKLMGLLTSALGLVKETITKEGLKASPRR